MIEIKIEQTSEKSYNEERNIFAICAIKKAILKALLFISVNMFVRQSLAIKKNPHFPIEKHFINFPSLIL